MNKIISRRKFVAGATMGTTTIMELGRSIAGAQDKADPKASPAAASPSAARPASHRPAHAKFSELPLDRIEPQGWLKAYLANQSKGLTGNLDKTGGFPFNTFGWAGHQISDVPAEWWCYEQTAYWVDGMTRCGHLLRDKDLIAKASQQINYVLDHADTDGYLGPQYLKNGNRWPHVVFFRALFAQSTATGDAKIVAAIKRHFLSSPHVYASGRDVIALEAMLWAYERDGDPALLKMAEDTYANFEKARGVNPAMFMDGKPSTAHGVGYNEAAKLGAIMFLYTGNQDYLKPSVAAYQKLDKFHMMVDGVNTSTEALREVTPLASHETCDITDYAWSVGYLLMATGEAEYSDKIERACFNAAPGAVTEDFTGLQYFSCPNQVIAAHNTNHNYFYRGERAMQYSAGHLDVAQCCSGNVNRVMPNFVARLWMGDSNKGIVAAMYGPSKVTHQVGEAQREVTITETTRYPFSDRIVFTMKMAQDTRFSFTVRIPGWCNAARITINNQPLQRSLAAGTFVTIDQTFRDRDEVVVTLPQETRVSAWPSDGIAVERGPLVYSLKIDEEWHSPKEVADAASAAVGTYDLNFKYPGMIGNEVFPKSPWNYALEVDAQNVAKNVQVVHMEWSDDHPWSRSAPPIALRVPARQVVGWKLEEATDVVEQGDWDHPGQEFTRHGQFVFTPPLPSASGPPVKLEPATETVTLVPYGCARLRLTIFPQAAKLART